MLRFFSFLADNRTMRVSLKKQGVFKKPLEIFALILGFVLVGCNLQPDEINLATFPQAPRGLSAFTDSPFEVTLSWDKPHDDGGKPITGYRIYRRPPDQTRFQVLVESTNSTSTSFTDTGLAGGDSYYYRIAAVNDVSSGEFSNEVFVSTELTVPDVPTELEVIAISDELIYLDWTAPARDGGSPVTGYRIERESPVGGGFSTILPNTGTPFTNYADSSVVAYTEYRYRVSAINNQGESESSDPSDGKTHCPDGFVEVAGNTSFGTSDFCVMEFEAKEGASGFAISVELLHPWVSVDLAQAKDHCTDLGGRYDLLSNPEWMTLAHNIESHELNWSSFEVGDGCLKQGNTGEFDTCSIDGGDVLFGDLGGRDHRARHELSSGVQIWDLSGNVAQWVDWESGGGLDLAPANTCTATDVEIPDVSSLTGGCGLDFSDYEPANSGGVPPSVYDSDYGLGQLDFEAERGAVRGGAYGDLGGAGLYSLHLLDPATTSSEIGFRCVYR